MKILFASITEALEKDLILTYLAKFPDRFINILEIRDKVFSPSFEFEKVRRYAEDLKSDKLVLSDKNNPSDIKYSLDKTFIDSGGHVRKFFLIQKIEFSAIPLVEAQHKDLILYYLFYLNSQGSKQLTDLDDLRRMFPLADNMKLRYYVDELRSDRYINSMASDDYIFRYYPSSDKFLENGGYVGEYLKQKLEDIEIKQLIEDEKLTPEELNLKRKVEKRKKYIESRKTGILYFLLKYGWIILLGIIVIVIALIKMDLITRKNAIDFVTWVIDRIK